MEVSDIRKFLTDFYNKDFPREFVIINNGILFYRKLINTFDEAYDKYWNLNGMSNIYMSVNSVREITNQEFSRIYMDFDDEIEPQNANKEALMVRNYVKNKYGGDPLLLYSGNKGSNIYIFMKPMNLQSYKETMRYFFDSLRNELDLKYLDYSSCGDYMRVSRIPYSINVNGGNLCSYIEGNQYDLTDLEFLKSIDEKFTKEKEDTKPIEMNPATLLSTDITERIIEHLDKLPNVSGNGWKRAFMYLIAPRLVMTHGLDEAKQVTREWFINSGWNDDLRWAFYQLQYAERKGSIPWRLDTFVNRFPDIAKYWRNV